jgi:hypothetical protein
VGLGIVLPVLCFVADPIVFRGFMGEPPHLLNYKLFAYGAAGLGMVALVLWLFLELRPGWWSAFLCGAMGIAGLLAGAIGLAILPLTFFGMMFLIGVLGLAPFATCWLYLRDAARAFRSSRAHGRLPALAALLLAGALAVVAPPAVAQQWVSHTVAASLDSIVSGRGDPDRATRRLARVSRRVGVNLDPLLRAYESDEDAARRERIANAYNALTGGDIELVISRMSD